ncbi:NAD(P)H-dependent flavin oxidoreductase [Phaeobacter gallaeciensis]|uniref:Nitronate monooxygenase n=1 Tax=Phaeobacter gallaeciensis TaxID=60890 RepID=A0AAC9ZBH0_9RHOB|nr:nitronate monooxygenase [Phaeobacter gallaeciensis]AHD10766.1 Dioxygenase [Phaeobacter gallaeciensis DSM 26640]ATE94029.1 Dioxygenase [Phaeobacter gallaeciensis]ATE96150.1 Dioxygenase [Phaeobacter gallaeciensis]ATF02693.1 Dioxygenase [Phaeobacter gallaeciensis]ATF07073.1 Dioxygenase [Phaeobacter gallaeciensis]
MAKFSTSEAFMDRLGISLPILQSPMAGVSTPDMAAAVSNAGGLGALGIGAASVGGAEAMIRQTAALTDKPFNINVFCHHPAVSDRQRESVWLRHLAPVFEVFQTTPPKELREIYTSFNVDTDMQAMLLTRRPAVVSFHFGLPPHQVIAALKSSGILLMATATSLVEAKMLEEAGIDVVVAQGWEAGGHRGVFDPRGRDERLGTLELVRGLVTELNLPVVAAGGLMTGADIAGALAAGAVAAQLGTVFIACPESSADAGYRDALLADDPKTEMTAAISGRPARCLSNRFTDWASRVDPEMIPDYPIAYDAGKALNAAAKQAGEAGYGAQWAGQGAAAARPMPTADLMQQLTAELSAAQ